ncbi:MAG: DUF4129 domain-containing protein [Planctomycetia bacterium]|nr:DUF4129 domain-containing protein [Planctomycetia bacterium]
MSRRISRWIGAGWIGAMAALTLMLAAISHVGIDNFVPLSILHLPSSILAPSLLALQGQSTTGGRFGDKEDIGREFDSLREQREFRRLRKEKPVARAEETSFEWPEWIKSFGRWLRDLVNSIGSFFSGLGVLFQILAYGILAAIAGLIIWLVVRAVNNYQAKQSLRAKVRRSHEEGEADAPPGDLPADEYLKRAAELAERGLFREAIGQLILGAMSRAERSGLIRFRRGLTHRDYLRALRSRATPHQAFKQIVAVYEPICFGRRPAQREHYATSLDGYQTGFREELSAVPASSKMAVSASAAGTGRN